MKALCALTLALALVGCGSTASTDGAGDLGGADGGADAAGSPPLAEVRCDNAAPVGPKGTWRHTIVSPTIVTFGTPRHRGVDLVLSESAEQRVRGDIKYGFLSSTTPVEKSLEDEVVEVWGCVSAGTWQKLGEAITDTSGGFDLPLVGANRLGVGLRPLYLSLVGDRSGARMLALVAPPGTVLAVTDVDGTQTASESAFPESLLTGNPVVAQDYGPQMMQAMKGQRHYPVYLTSRGRYFTQQSRDWLAERGYPLGPLHLAGSLITIPGEETVAYKADALKEMTDAGLKLGAGVGNRKSDVEAYERAGLPAARIFIKRPEYDAELMPLYAAGRAQGVLRYSDLAATVLTFPPGP